MPPVQARPIYSILQALDRNFRRTRPQCGCRSNVAVITDASSGWEREADGNIWSRGPDLNRGPADYESAALPTELPRRLLDCNIGAKKLSNFGRIVCAAQERPGSGPFLRVHGIIQRDIGYISQATPRPTSTNNANDHRTYLTPPARVRCERHASANETSSANSSIAPKWLSRSALLRKIKAPQITQTLLPVEISIVSSTANRFTTPAAAIKRVP